MGSVFVDDAPQRLDCGKLIEPIGIVFCRQDIEWSLCDQCRGNDGGREEKMRELKDEGAERRVIS